MNERRLIGKSKWLSRHLRHAPEEIGLQLEIGGWVLVADLLKAAEKYHFALSLEELKTIVAQNDKQRFSFDDAGQKIRANQGHSTDVNLQLKSQIAPEILFHGSSEKNKASILKDGLQKMKRHHVHLSSDLETARRVGARHGKPIIFCVDTAQMQQDGIDFYCSENGVWLTECIPPRYLKLLVK